MRAAVARRMDRIFYGMKRAYHSTLRIARRDFKEIEMTPARMDILHALYNRGRRWQRPMWQSQLRRIIGYTARSTMTQIMQALEKLLLVHRRRSEQDARQLEVELTGAGRYELCRAYGQFFPGWSLDAPNFAKDWAPPAAEETQAWEAYVEKVGRLDKILSNIRVALRDTGTLRYRWVDE
jgi:DNA-binding MarR family transcriptional regulator